MSSALSPGVLGVGQRTAMEAFPGVHTASFTLLALGSLYPGGGWFSVKGQQRRRRKQASGAKLPFISVKGGKLAAIRTFAPAQATVGKRNLVSLT